MTPRCKFPNFFLCFRSFLFLRRGTRWRGTAAGQQCTMPRTWVTPGRSQHWRSQRSHEDSVLFKCWHVCFFRLAICTGRTSPSTSCVGYWGTTSNTTCSTAWISQTLTTKWVFKLAVANPAGFRFVFRFSILFYSIFYSLVFVVLQPLCNSHCHMSCRL